jgi:two-component sensor histidine kinase
MPRLMRILLWRSAQPALIRLLTACTIFGAALAARLILGRLNGANPGLIFYPAILVAALLGWREAVLVLALALITATWLFLPPGMYLLPVGWALVGGLNIAIIAGLRSLAQELAAANDRQRILFQELQHRVANTLQAAVGALEISRKHVASAAEEASQLLEAAAHRLATSADVHRRLNDPTLFRRGLESILRDAVASVIDPRTVSLTFDVEDLDLTFDQMSVITMLVIEAAHNAQKHVFRQGRGTRFSVVLGALPGRRVGLTIKDDGPGIMPPPELTGKTLGMGIIEGLVRQLGGTARTGAGDGTEFTVEFSAGR